MADSDRVDPNSNIPTIIGGIMAGIIVLGLIIWFLRWLSQGKAFTKKDRIDGKVVIITGANTGIGKATAFDLAERGAKVYMACRDYKRCEEARLDIVQRTGNINVFNRTLNLASLESIRTFAKEFINEENRLDILINNAGLVPNERRTTVDGFEMQIGVMHMGHFLLTNLLLDILKTSAPSRIIMVSSRGHAIGTIKMNDLNTEHTNYNQLMVYCQAKLANVLFARELSKRLQGTGITVNSLHPGVVKTEITRDVWYYNCLVNIFQYFYRTPEAGAQTVIMCAVDPELAVTSGRYFDNCKLKKESTRACDDKMAEWLWKTSEEWTKLKETP